MEINGTTRLWQDYDPGALPLNISTLSEKTTDGCRITEYYYDGFVTTDGRVRAYLKITEPMDSKGVILYLSDNTGETGSEAKEYYTRGYTVAELDYLGKSDDYPRFTLYPKSLEDCNLRGKKQFDAPEQAIRSCWYIWTCIARRAIRLLREKYPEEKLFAIGKGLGGTTVYKLCAFNDGLTAAATLLNIIPDVFGEGNRMIHYRAALDNDSYAPYTKVPIYIAVASNDQDGSLDKMSELAENTESLKCFRIAERMFAGGLKIMHETLIAFFDRCLEAVPDIPTPELKIVNSNNKLYFHIDIRRPNGKPLDTRLHEKIEIFASFDVINPKYRNWSSLKVISLNENEYVSTVEVYKIDTPVYAFVNISASNGNTVSSPLAVIVPKTLGITEQRQLVPRRLIYDGSMGNDVWSSPNGGTISTQEGPMGIPGVTSESNNLTTFKPGNVLYRAKSDALLQLILCGEPQTLKISVNDGVTTYETTIQIPSSGEWHKITMQYFDFKSKNGQLTNWEKIIMLEINSDKQYLVNSVLWV